MEKDMDTVTLWMANVDGVAPKQDKVWARAFASGAEVVMLAETHLQDVNGLGRAARFAGFPACITSSLNQKSCGVAICGPQNLREDPWRWPPGLLGRVVSGILHGRLAQTLIIMTYFNVADEAARTEMANQVAERIARAGLPVIVAGDFNEEPHGRPLESLEAMCDYCHETVGYEYLSTPTRCIDYFMSNGVAVQEVCTEPEVTFPHCAVRCKVELPSSGSYATYRKAETIVPPEDWPQRWRDAWTCQAQDFQHCLEQGEVVRAWDMWCSTLESSAGVRSPSRHLGTQLVRREMVHKGPDGSRQTCVERRLYRILRRLRQRREAGPTMELDRSIRRSLRALVREDVVSGDPEDYDNMEKAIFDKLYEVAESVKKSRIAKWREDVAGGNLRSIHRSLAKQ